MRALDSGDESALVALVDELEHRAESDRIEDILDDIMQEKYSHEELPHHSSGELNRNRALWMGQAYMRLAEKKFQLAARVEGIEL